MALHEKVAEPEPVTLAGLTDPQDRPGECVRVKVTVPENPLTATTVTVEIGDWPTLTGAGDVTVMVKFWNRRIAVAECDREPLEPVMVIV